MATNVIPPAAKEARWSGAPGLAAKLALAKGREDETNNSKFAKRTWNVPWNQQFHFLASHFTPRRLHVRGAGSARFAPQILRLFQVFGVNGRKPEMRDLRYISHGAGEGAER